MTDGAGKLIPVGDSGVPPDVGKGCGSNQDSCEDKQDEGQTHRFHGRSFPVHFQEEETSRFQPRSPTQNSETLSVDLPQVSEVVASAQQQSNPDCHQYAGSNDSREGAVPDSHAQDREEADQQPGRPGKQAMWGNGMLRIAKPPEVSKGHLPQDRLPLHNPGRNGDKHSQRKTRGRWRLHSKQKTTHCQEDSYSNPDQPRDDSQRPSAG